QNTERGCSHRSVIITTDDDNIVTLNDGQQRGREEVGSRRMRFSLIRQSGPGSISIWTQAA
ncbi:hypothetical protein, partial [Mycolicibacterium obuense]|uniref:hypothetical protein n=1 Tax=Mycolicibacterium obuense TaxID=1807 RepID=UPI001F172074